jgi:O-acetylhomoserine/O-acetylserine sulfhydrylase
LIRVSLGLEDIKDIIYDFQQAFVAAGLKPAEKGVDPFATASSNVSSGFMKDLSTRMPKPGTDGSEGWEERNKRSMATSV